MNLLYLIFTVNLVVAVLFIGNAVPQSLGDEPVTSIEGDFIIKEITSGLDVPSSFEFDGRDILVAQKFDGNIKLIRDFDVKKYSVHSLDSSTYGTNGGLSGLAKATVGNITYIFAFNGENSVNTNIDAENKYNRIYRYVWNSTGLELENSTLIVELPANPFFINNGGKMIVGPNNHLYITLGDMNNNGWEQNLLNSVPENAFIQNYGKSGGILRITLEGIPPVGNPFAERDYRLYFAYGIRNSFGLAFDPLTNYLWDTEQGPGSNDEINLVKHGFNSGWKIIQGNSEDTCCNEAIVLSQDPEELFEINGSYYDEPRVTLRNSTGLTGIVFYNSSLMGPEYENSMFVGDMNGNIYNFNLHENREFLITDDNITKNIFAKGFGPISDLKVGTDGLLYILTFSNNTDSPYSRDTGQIFSISRDPNEINPERNFVSYDQIALISTAVIIIAILTTFQFKAIMGVVKKLIKKERI